MTVSDRSGLEIPGDWIAHEDRDKAFEIDMILKEFVGALDEAALVLALYNEATASGPPHPADRRGSNQRLRRLYAKCFVYALDEATQLALVLEKDPGVPEQAKQLCRRFNSSIPDLRDLRNSLHHTEDRIRGLGRDKTPLPTPLIIMRGFAENRLCATTDKEERPYAEVEISHATLSVACRIAEELIWSFEWIGPGDQPVRRPVSDDSPNEEERSK